MFKPCFSEKVGCEVLCLSHPHLYVPQHFLDSWTEISISTGSNVRQTGSVIRPDGVNPGSFGLNAGSSVQLSRAGHD